MKKPGSTHARSRSRKSTIIDAALSCFTECGVDETKIGDICRRSKASVGSIYHHFGNKDGLARAVYMEGVRRFQEGLVTELKRHRDAKGGIFAMIRYHIDWAVKHRDWARYLFQKRHADFMGSTDEVFGEMNRDFARQISGWFGGHVKEGALRLLPPDLYPCILFGPCQEFLHHYLAGYTVTPIQEAAEKFGQAAWHALALEEDGENM